MKKIFIPLLFILCNVSLIHSQDILLKVVNQSTSTPISGAHISIFPKGSDLVKLRLKAITDDQGIALLPFDSLTLANSNLLLSHVSYKSKIIRSDSIDFFGKNLIQLDEHTRELGAVVVVFSEPYIQKVLIQVEKTSININGTARQVKGFLIQKNEVTVRQFREFIRETDYITEVEAQDLKVSVIELQNATNKYLTRFKTIKQEPFKKAKKKRFQGWERKFRLVEKSGINWRHDEFGELRSEAEMDFPVINITWMDAKSYAKWANMKLPTLEQWIASAQNSKKDGWHRKFSTGILKNVSTSPANRQGIQNLYGNVSEFLATPIILNGERYIQTTAFHSLASEYTKITETLLVQERSVLKDIIKYGFRCVKDSID
ncbi:SUMF1/EgtB/PvdO family nonheme iron enzyme [Roseivirga misakiensis]|uniref:Sulfatase-modifying factor enzyme-like domain-containing protein n=1 Tax=Roseivirga misakiensis TaxID=1563681 RepID=A0A1E5T7U3_9BACT|nr:SUMF1/EgtB/PvdO family nonheme iron enzyme [Roseivirga misakiensis]OEK07454.1 hypothetical protein BFP71_00150 [Roseivirga misakiensis]